MNWGGTNHLVQLIPFLSLLTAVLCKDLFWWLEAPVILAFCQACYRQSWMQVILFTKQRDLYNDTYTLWQDKGTSTLLRNCFLSLGLSLFNCTAPNLLLVILNASSMRYLSNAQVPTGGGLGVTEPPESGEGVIPKAIGARHSDHSVVFISTGFPSQINWRPCFDILQYPHSKY